MSKSQEKRSRNQTLRKLLAEKANEQREADAGFVNSRTATIAGKDALFAEELKKTLKGVFHKGWTKPQPYRGKKTSHVERLEHIIISDTHFQSLLDPEECPVEYGAIQESRRFAKVVTQVADYKRQYRAQTQLRVKLLGDLFQGQLHDQREGSPLTMQFAATLHYLLQGILFWAHEFRSVQVDCVPGNHGRLKTRHVDRAVQQKWDAIETMVYHSLKTAVAASGATNVKINIGMRPYIIEEIFDKKAFWTHGDTVLKPGYPGKSIDVGGLYQQICRWNSARRINGPFSIFGVGHVHFGSITNMPGEVVMLTNGCLVPPDPFALSIGAPDVTCGQYMFESVRGHVCGDQRFIHVDDADGAKELNKVITPFKSL
jgi:hypothetical protein